MGMTGSEMALEWLVCDAVAAAPPARLLEGGPLPVTVSPSRYVVVIDGVFGDCKFNWIGQHATTTG